MTGTRQAVEERNSRRSAQHECLIIGGSRFNRDQIAPTGCRTAAQFRWQAKQERVWRDWQRGLRLCGGGEGRWGHHLLSFLGKLVLEGREPRPEGGPGKGSNGRERRLGRRETRGI